MSLYDPSIPSAPAQLRLGHRLGTWLGKIPERFRRPMSGGTYRAEIDGLRFVAIAVVIVGHFMERAVRFFPNAHAQIEGNSIAALFQRPGMGVYLFFAISGFIITSQVKRAKTAPLSGSFLRAYFGRRILRIEPPYVLLLVATYLALTATGYTPDLTNHFNSGPQSLGVSLAGSVLYLHGLIWGVYPRLFPPGWSLEAEVQFYILAPLLFWAFFKIPHGPVRVAVGALGLGLGALSSLFTPEHIGAVHTDAGILRFFHFFWLGILLADFHGWIVDSTKTIPPSLISLLGWAGLLGYLVMPNAPDDNLLLALLIRAATYVTMTAVFVSAFAQASTFRAFCVRPWISFIGGACYSIYLIHLQAIQAMTTILAKIAPASGIGSVVFVLVIESIVVVAAGLCFYLVVERTFMIADWPQLFWRRIRRLCRPASLGLVVEDL